MTTNINKLSYTQLHEGTIKLAIDIKPHDVQHVIGLTRGGLFPATLISHLLRLPMTAINYSSKKGKGDDKNHTNTLDTIPNCPLNSTILCVDDICDSGYTMKEVYDYYSQYYNVLVASLYFKDTSIIKPDFYLHQINNEDGWIYFPWEDDINLYV